MLVVTLLFPYGCTATAQADVILSDWFSVVKLPLQWFVERAQVSGVHFV